ncbi:MAG: DNA alkylation repair protein [Bradymonadales bacterium]|nr:MAG: DNA alkylation repair protein [Bradymonadales bacterium]
MPKKLKDYYNLQLAELLSEKIKREKKGFRSKNFIDQIRRGLRGREFLERQDLFAEALEKELDEDYSGALKLFTKILGPELETETGMFREGWWLWPIGRFVERNAGTEPSKINESLDFIKELTKRFTGEFAIRPLLEKYPKRSLSKLKSWSREPSVHVRRLSSEGIRIRLPWAKKLNLFKDYFEACYEILEHLKDSPEKFVQKSVGNNLNDLFKEEPALARKIVANWTRPPVSPQTLWILKHGQRWRRRSGH